MLLRGAAPAHSFSRRFGGGAGSAQAGGSFAIVRYVVWQRRVRVCQGSTALTHISGSIRVQ